MRDGRLRGHLPYLVGGSIAPNFLREVARAPQLGGRACASRWHPTLDLANDDHAFIIFTPKKGGRLRLSLCHGQQVFDSDVFVGCGNLCVSGPNTTAGTPLPIPQAVVSGRVTDRKGGLCAPSLRQWPLLRQHISAQADCRKPGQTHSSLRKTPRGAVARCPGLCRVLSRPRRREGNAHRTAPRTISPLVFSQRPPHSARDVRGNSQ